MHFALDLIKIKKTDFTSQSLIKLFSFCFHVVEREKRFEPYKKLKNAPKNTHMHLWLSGDDNSLGC